MCATCLWIRSRSLGISVFDKPLGHTFLYKCHPYSINNCHIEWNVTVHSFYTEIYTHRISFTRPIIFTLQFGAKMTHFTFNTLNRCLYFLYRFLKLISNQCKVQYTYIGQLSFLKCVCVCSGQWQCEGDSSVLRGAVSAVTLSHSPAEALPLSVSH